MEPYSVAAVCGRFFRLDGIRLSRRTHAARLALRQFALRDHGYVRFCEGFVLSPQGTDDLGKFRTPPSSLELAGKGRYAAGCRGLHELRLGGTVPERQIARKTAR